MPGDPGAMLWAGHADVTAVPQVREVVCAFAANCGFDRVALGDVRIAVSEAFTNAVVHAYRDVARSEVEVWAALVDHHLEIQVVDHGIGLRARPDSPGLGIGLSLIATVMDDLQMQQTPLGGTTVVMRLRVTTDSEPQSAASCAGDL